jgi:site-specific DNA-methyltransferase (adenine-specific)
VATQTARLIFEKAPTNVIEMMPEKLAITNGESTAGILIGSALQRLRELPADTFHVIVTSPPYYWARDYGVDGQLGHEDSVDEYVEKLAAICDELKRVLHPEGVFFLNIGDTYYSGNGQPHGSDPRSPSRDFMRKKLRAVDRSGWSIPKKSLIGVPWKVAFELQKRKWTLRSDIIWNRGNAFVEPTALDRPYRQHEHIFLFSKTRFYSFDRTQLAEEDVWTIPIERNKATDHSAPFPSALVSRCIETGSPKGGFVLDPFVGSGTTLDVALNTGRHAIGIELNPVYIAEFVHRIERRRCQRMAWETFIQKFANEPGSWKTWKGNRSNYRKPKSNRKRELM